MEYLTEGNDWNTNVTSTVNIRCDIHSLEVKVTLTFNETLKLILRYINGISISFHD